MEVAVIKFYSVNERYGEFSSFALYPIWLKGKTWATSEYYFQAQKFKGTPQETKIRKTRTPMLAAQLGRSRNVKLRPDWERVKDSVMYDAVYAKMTQHPALQALLLSTGTAKLMEHTANDAYWGDGGNGKGQNKLGQILMKIRTALNR